MLDVIVNDSSNVTVPVDYNTASSNPGIYKVKGTGSYVVFVNKPDPSIGDINGVAALARLDDGVWTVPDLSQVENLSYVRCPELCSITLVNKNM